MRMLLVTGVWLIASSFVTGTDELTRLVGPHPTLGELRLTPGTRAACDLFLQVAAAARIPAGCEDASEDNPPSRRDRDVTLSGMSAGAAVETLSAAFPAYRAKLSSGVLIVRPIDSWVDTHHYLHRALPAVTFGEEGGVHETFRVIHRLWTGADRPWPDGATMRTRRLHVTFPGGSLVDLLAEVVRADGELLWHVSYDEVRHSADAFFLRFETFDGHGMGSEFRF